MTLKGSSASRREFLRGSSSLLLGGLVPSGAALQAGPKPAPKVPSADTQMKFFPTGEPRPFAGNTIICHLPQQCEFRDAVTAFGAALRTSPVASKLAFLPPESYHLTIFPGVTDQIRSHDAWPADIPVTVSIEECNRILGERLADFRLECRLPLRLKLDVAETVAYRGAITLRMQPIDDAEEQKIRRLRDRLADLYRYRARDHDTYAFHIGLAYRIKPFTDAGQTAYETLADTHARAIAASAPYLEVGLPAYCTFHDMYRFNIRKLLNS